MRWFYCVPTINVLSKNKKTIRLFHLNNYIFTAFKNVCIVHERDSVMLDRLRHLSLVVKKPVFGFPTMSDTNRAVLPQKMARGL